MPRRDEEKRIAFLRTLSVEDLANRRITEFSSETEKQMIHAARDTMKEKNDERWIRRYKKKAAVDSVKTQVGGIGRRAQTEVFGKEGGLSGGMVGSWITGQGLLAGTVVGGSALAARMAAKRYGIHLTPEQLRKAQKSLDFLGKGKNKSLLTKAENKQRKAIRNRAESGKLTPTDIDDLKDLKKAVERKSKNNLLSKPPETSSASQASATPSASSASNSARVLTGNEKSAIEKLKQGQRLSPNERTALQALAKDKKLTQAEQNLLENRKRLAQSQRELKALKAKPAATDLAKPVSPAKSTSTKVASSGSELTEVVQNKLDADIQKITALKLDKGNDKAFDKLAINISKIAEKYPDKVQQNYVIESLVLKAARFNKNIPDVYKKLTDLLKKK